jgi:hypothetical protein
VATVVVPILAATGPVTLSAISAAIIIANVKTVKMRFFTGFHLLFPFSGMEQLSMEQLSIYSQD